MAWTAPRTYVAGEVLTAAIMNIDHRDNLLDLHSRFSAPDPVHSGNYVHVSLSAPQTVPSGVETKVLFNLASTNEGGCFDLANSRYVVPTSGKYMVGTAVYFNLLTGRLAILLRRNGDNLRLAAVWSGGDDVNAPVGDVAVFTAGDLVEVFALHEQGTPKDVVAGAQATYFTAVRVQ